MVCRFVCKSAEPAEKRRGVSSLSLTLLRACAFVYKSLHTPDRSLRRYALALHTIEVQEDHDGQKMPAQ
jgi:hypothetical protein